MPQTLYNCINNYALCKTKMAMKISIFHAKKLKKQSIKEKSDNLLRKYGKYQCKHQHGFCQRLGQWFHVTLQKSHQ